VGPNLPTALYIADPFVQQVKNQSSSSAYSSPTREGGIPPTYVAMAFPKGQLAVVAFA
jgi:hypothetical protein